MVEKSCKKKKNKSNWLRLRLILKMLLRFATTQILTRPLFGLQDDEIKGENKPKIKKN